MDDPTTENVTEGFGLMDYGARMYDPALGRFTSADTPSTSSGQRIIPSTQGAQGWDRYAYVNNNPVRYTDPTGHICVNDDGDGDVAMAGNCGGGANSNYNGGLQGPAWNGNSGSASTDEIVSSLPEGPACTVNYCGQQNDLSVSIHGGSNAANSINGFKQTLHEIERLFNWSLTTPGEMTLYNSPGYPFFGGVRIFYQPFFIHDNDSPLTISPTYISSGSVSMGFNGTFRYKQGLNSITALGIVPPGSYQPWAFKVNIDTTLRAGDIATTHRIGAEYVARPDNLSWATAIYAAVEYGPSVIVAIRSIMQSSPSPGCIPGTC